MSKNNTGTDNSGYSNSGNCNSGNYNSGWFNTNEPKMRFFNKDSDMTYSEFSSKYSFVYPDLKTCSWVYAKDMTDQEKKDHPDFETTDGYLKTMTYKEAWAEYWNRASDEDKKFFTTLPNFDSAIFLEITGIDVEKKENKDDFCEKCNCHCACHPCKHTVLNEQGLLEAISILEGHINKLSNN